MWTLVQKLPSGTATFGCASCAARRTRRSAVPLRNAFRVHYPPAPALLALLPDVCVVRLTFLAPGHPRGRQSRVEVPPRTPQPTSSPSRKRAKVASASMLSLVVAQLALPASPRASRVAPM